MEMLSLLNQYIERLDNASTLDKTEIEALIEDVTRVVLSQDELRELCLDYYSSYGEEDGLQSDLRKLKAKLEYERATLIDADEKLKKQTEAEHEQRELEKLRLQVELAKGNITIQNTNHNENHNTMTVTFEAVREAIDNMTSLPDEEIQEVKKKIDELEAIVKSKDSKSKKWSKAKDIIKWVADKGVDVGIALLPLILQIK